ncbi:MAG: AIR carboxylase family protein [bacterium]|nr:AIR carboxylase family protein [bacterium]
MGIQVAIVVGSESDLGLVKESGMLEVLSSCGVGWELSIISAHRNKKELSDYCQEAVKEKMVKVFIAAAGMAAALPGDIAAEIKFSLPVIGVPLPSAEFPNALDALLAITRVPGGCPVAMTGIGKAGLKNAALLAVQILTSVPDASSVMMRMKSELWLKENTKTAKIAAETNQKGDK